MSWGSRRLIRPVRRPRLHGAGFIVTPTVAAHLGLGRRPGLDRHIRAYRNGRDLMARPRNVMVIDLDGLSAEEVRSQFPEVYQHVLEHVRPERDTNNEEYRRVNWWLFGRRDTLMRGCTDGLRRYIVTVGTAKHRVFQFLDETILPNNMLVAIGSDDGFILGTLSSRFHVAWAIRSGGWLGMGNDPRYSKSRCFDPFPFPAADDLQKHRIRTVADLLDRHRKDVLARHAHLTLTGLYNVLEKLRAGVGPDVLDGDDRRIFDDGLVLILKEYHDSLDQAVAAAYGWPADLPEAEVLARLVALNRARVREEAAGTVRWLRPDYQIPRYGTAADKVQLDLAGGAMRDVAAAPAGPKPGFPSGDLGQTAAVMSMLAGADGPLAAGAIAARFRQGRRALPQIEAVLASLVWGGYVSQSDRGGFMLRRAA